MSGCKDVYNYPIKAYKLLWLADRYHLRQFGRTITQDKYCILSYYHGIVPFIVKQIIEEKGNILKECKKYLDYSLKRSKYSTRVKYYFESLKESDIHCFSKSDLNVLDLILSKYGDLSAKDLLSLFYQFPEYIKVKSSIQKQQFPIKIDLVDFFLNYNDGKGLFNDSEEYLALSKELFLEYSL